MRRDWRRNPRPIRSPRAVCRSIAIDLRRHLHDLVAADPVLDAITVIETDDVGQPHVFISTSTEERVEVLELAARALAANNPPRIAATPSSPWRCRCRTASAMP